GELVDVPGASGTFDGVVELGQELASNQAVEECMVRQWFRYVLERFEQNVDSCSVKALVDEFRGAEASLSVLPAAIVRTDAFLYRRPITE
ncbi:MAG TPA: DUF1585 domain-containing protein, partial [Polyangiaceae bacterium]